MHDFEITEVECPFCEKLNQYIPSGKWRGKKIKKFTTHPPDPVVPFWDYLQPDEDEIICKHCGKKFHIRAWFK